jgi:hypothetical protein
MIAELDANLTSIGTDKKERIVVNLEGEDEEFVANALAKDYGQSLSSEKLLPNTEYLGRLLDVGKFGYGIYVDIGVIDSPRMDALIPLHKMREQLNMVGPLKSITDAFVLVDQSQSDEY